MTYHLFIGEEPPRNPGRAYSDTAMKRWYRGAAISSPSDEDIMRAALSAYTGYYWTGPLENLFRPREDWIQAVTASTRIIVQVPPSGGPW